MVANLTVRSVRLLPNTPPSAQELVHHGISVEERLPHIIHGNEYNRFYLESKAHRSVHFLNLAGHGTQSHKGPYLPFFGRSSWLQAWLKLLQNSIKQDEAGSSESERGRRHEGHSASTGEIRGGLRSITPEGVPSDPPLRPAICVRPLASVRRAGA